MLEKNSEPKIKPIPEFQKNVTEILVANGRSFEPFVKTFSYSGENIAKASLGSLIGVFEVSERSEDSAYIVNFLASVAKKEYFSNHHRGAIESFEAALHKVNLALAELVKHGNVAWLGKFHGALAVLEKNNLHFSVTGEGRILLWRNGTWNEISLGLASEESAVHPLKTFVEVSSGRLLSEDRILLSAPELANVLSPDDLRKSAERMDNERFLQFLKTALRNELDMTGVVVIDVLEAAILPAPAKVPNRTRKTAGPTKATLQNVFSQTAFREKDKTTESVEAALQARQAEEEQTAKTEYIDSKTGHIYIQGDTPETPDRHPLVERLLLALQDVGPATRSFFLSQARLFRKGKKQGLIALDTISDRALTIGRRTFRAIRREWRRKTAVPPKPSALEEEPVNRATGEEVFFSIETPYTKPTIPEERPVTHTPPVSAATEPVRQIRIEEDTQETVISFTDEPPTPTQTPRSDGKMPAFLKDKLASFYRQGPRETLPETDSPRPTLMQTVHTYRRLIVSELQGYRKHIELPSRKQAADQQTPVALSVPDETPAPTTPSFKERLAALEPALSAARKTARDIWKRSLTSLKLVSQGVQSFVRELSPTQKKIVAGALFALLLVGGLVLWFLWKTVPEVLTPAPATEVPTETKEASLAPPNEKNAALFPAPTTLLNGSGFLRPVILGNEIYIITERGIRATTSGQTYPVPGEGNVLFSAPMDDLQLIFLFTDRSELYAWSPLNRSFTKNTLPLPDGARIKSIGTYLTYLYVLDQTSNQIYRFPRAEGGFGAGSTWLRDSVTLEDQSLLAVNETLFLATNNRSVTGYFRGRASATLEAPTTELALSALFTHPGLQNIYALDAANKRLLVWNQQGALLQQYYSEALASGRALSTDEKSGAILVTTPDALLSFRLDPSR